MRNLIVACVLGLSLLCVNANAATITITRNFNQPMVGGYLVAGSFTLSGTVTAAGDIIGTGTLSDTSAALCGSASRVVVDVIFSGAAATTAASGFLPVYDNSTANAPKVFIQNANTAANPFTSTNALAIPASVVGRFIAICK